MPVSPPTVKRKINPSPHNMGTSQFIREPHMVASHLNTLIPVGTPMIIVAAEKQARVSTSMPTVNMWWAHTIKPKIPILNIAQIIPRVPNDSGFREWWATT